MERRKSTIAGNSITVGVRIRPVNDEVVNEELKVEQNQIQWNKDFTFSFDHVFPATCTQLEMYNECMYPLLDPLMDGYNVTILAYGQTSSGKTYSMGSGKETMGCNDSEDTMGCIPRFLDDLFKRIEGSEKQGNTTTVTVSFLEIYREQIRDLLFVDAPNIGTPRKKRDNLLLRQDSTKGIWVPGLRQIDVSNKWEALEQLRLGSLQRVTASTNMNETSSRSHAVYTVTTTQNIVVEAKSNDTMHQRNVATTTTTIISKLTFVDLAGSERLKKTMAQGDRMKEGIQINGGLLALGNVINALGDEKYQNGDSSQFVPYRSSRLTRLLQDALGGNSRTFFLACVSPAQRNSNESVNTLKYANRARNIKNKAIRNLDISIGEVAQLQSWSNLLQNELIGTRFGKLELSISSLINDSGQLDLTLYEKHEESIRQLARKPGAVEYIDLLKLCNNNLLGTSFKLSKQPHNERSLHNSLSPELGILTPPPAISELDMSFLEIDHTSSEQQEISVEEDLSAFNQDMFVLNELLEIDIEELKFVKEIEMLEWNSNVVQHQIQTKTLQLKALKVALTSEIEKRPLNNPYVENTDDVQKPSDQKGIAQLTDQERHTEKTNRAAEIGCIKRSITALEKKMHSFEIEQSRLQTQYDSFLVQMKGKMKSLIKDSPIYEYSEEILALMNRKKEEQLTNRNELLATMMIKTKDTKKQICRLLQNRNNDPNSRNSQRSSQSRTRDSQSGCTDSLLVRNLVHSIQNDLNYKALSFDLTNKLRERSDLLQQVISHVNQREQAVNDAMRATIDASLQDVDEQLSVCETFIDELRTTIHTIEDDRDTTSVKECIAQCALQDKNSSMVTMLIEEVEYLKLNEHKLLRKGVLLNERIQQYVQQEESNLDLINKATADHEPYSLKISDPVADNLVDVELRQKNSQLENKIVDLRANLEVANQQLAKSNEKIVAENSFFLPFHHLWNEIGVDHSDRSLQLEMLKDKFSATVNLELKNLQSQRERLQCEITLLENEYMIYASAMNLPSFAESTSSEIPLLEKINVLTERIELAKASAKKRVQSLYELADRGHAIFKSLGWSLDRAQQLSSPELENLRLDMCGFISSTIAWKTNTLHKTKNLQEDLKLVGESYRDWSNNLVTQCISTQKRVKARWNACVERIQLPLLTLNFNSVELKNCFFAYADAIPNCQTISKDEVDCCIALLSGDEVAICMSDANFILLEALNSVVQGIYEGRLKEVNRLDEIFKNSKVFNYYIKDYEATSIHTCDTISDLSSDVIEAKWDLAKKIEKRIIEARSAIIYNFKKGMAILQLDVDAELSFIIDSVLSSQEQLVENGHHDVHTYDAIQLAAFVRPWLKNEHDEGSNETSSEMALLVPYDTLNSQNVSVSKDSITEALSKFSQTQKIVDIVQPFVLSVQKIFKYLSEIRKYNKKIAEFEVSASNSERLFDRRYGSARLLEEEKFRKQAARRYPLLVKKIREEAIVWQSMHIDNRQSYFNLSMLGDDIAQLLNTSMTTKTELMHLNLSLVDVLATQQPHKQLEKPTPALTEPVVEPNRTSEVQGLVRPSGIPRPNFARRN